MNKEYAQECVQECAQKWNAPKPVESRASAPKAGAVSLKQIVTIRLDTDMLAWYKGAGAGYQTRINQILRQHMAQHQAAHQGGSGAEPN